MSIGRNDPCTCGSGKKYKKCCLLNETVESNTLKSLEVGTLSNKTMNETEKEDYLLEITKLEYDSSHAPKIRAISKYKADLSLREMVLATVEAICHMMYFKKPAISSILWNIEDIEKICNSKDLKREFVDLSKEMFNLDFSHTKTLMVRYDKGEKINEGEIVLLKGLLDDFNSYVRMPIVLQQEFVDYNFFRLHAELVLSILEKKLISENQYVTFIDLHIGVKKGIEIVSDFKLSFADEPLEVKPYFVQVIHENELYNYLSVLKHDYPYLTTKTIRELSKAIADEKNFDEYNEEHISLNPAFLSWMISLEQELKEVFVLVFNDMKFKNYRLEKLIDYFFEAQEFTFDDHFKTLLHEARMIRNKITHQDYEASIDDLQFVRETIYDHGLLQYLNAVKRAYGAKSHL